MKDDLFSYNPKTDDLTREDGWIALVNRDGCCIWCEASDAEIAEATGHEVEYTTKGAVIDNWNPGHWPITEADMLMYLLSHKSMCVLDVDKETIYQNIDMIIAAVKEGMVITMSDGELRERIRQLKRDFDALLKLIATPAGREMELENN